MAKQEALTLDGKRKFGILDKLAYAAGDFGCNMSFALKGTVQTFWLVYMGMETELLAILLVLVQIWDAVNDPLIGSIIDRDKRKYKHGKFKTYIFVGACGLLVAGAAVFIPFPGADKVVKAMLFIIGYIIWDACYTVANVPYGSMLSLVTEDTSERAQLSTWRSLGSVFGNMVPMALLPTLIWKKATYDKEHSFLKDIVIPEGFKESQFTTKPDGSAYEVGEVILSPETGKDVSILLGERVFWIALVMGVIGFIAFLFMLKFITIRADESSVKTNERTEKFNVIKSFGNFMKNRPAVGATLAAMGMFLGMQSSTTANSIMFATFFEMPDASGIVQVIGFLPMFIFIPFIKKIVDRFGKKEASTVGSIISLVGAAAMMIFPLFKDNVIIALIIYIGSMSIYGLGMGIYTCVSWALISDAIDYNEWKFGKREEGVVYSLHSFFRKLAQGAGPSAVILVMGWLGYESKKGTIAQSAETTINMCWLVAGLFLVSAVLQFVGLVVIYNLDKKTLERMHKELAERRAYKPRRIKKRKNHRA